MLDLETMGNGPRAAIVAIGVCEFDPCAGFDDAVVISTFYSRVSLQSSVSVGLDIDASTVLWWMQQSDAARKSTFEGADIGSLDTVLRMFNGWLVNDFSSAHPIAVWGNGATFDNVIIRSAYKACGIEPPWSFRNDKCYRTVVNLAPKVPFEKYGTAHNALDDAIAQALHLQKVWKALGLRAD
jgi:exodeoxyribonuclease VIII